MSLIEDDPQNQRKPKPFGSKFPTYREKAPTKSTKPMFYIRETLPAQIYTKRISLGDVGIADDGCRLLIELVKDGTEIEGIDLRGNRITSYGLEDLVLTLRKIDNLNFLALNWNDLENDHQNGMNSLANYINDGACPVRYLDLRNANLSDDSSSAIEKLVKAPKLTHLDLSWNSLGASAAEAITRGLYHRVSDIALEIKGCTFSEKSLHKIKDALDDLRKKHGKLGDKTEEEVSPGVGNRPEDILGFKRMELEKLYNPTQEAERKRKLLSDGSRIILNPHTAELEILMGEMIRKKIMAKDRVLRELDSIIAENREADNEIERLKTKLQTLNNDNLVVTDELERMRGNYTKLKEHARILNDSLRSQISHVESLINRRDIQHRAMIDRINNEQRSNLRNLNNDWEEKIRFLEQRIKGMAMDKDKMENELVTLSQKIESHRGNFDIEYKKRIEDTKMESKARADHTARALETRLLGLTESAEMMHRRGNDELSRFQIEEKKAFEMIRMLNIKKRKLKKELSDFDNALKQVNLHNDKIQNEIGYFSGIESKLKSEANDLTDAITHRNNVLKENISDLKGKYNKDEKYGQNEKRQSDEKIQNLELKLKGINAEIEKLESKKHYFVEIANRNVSKVIYETLVNRKYLEESNRN